MQIVHPSIEDSDSVQDVGRVDAESDGNRENNAVIGVGGSGVIQYVFGDAVYTHGSSSEAPSYYTTRHSTSENNRHIINARVSIETSFNTIVTKMKIFHR